MKKKVGELYDKPIVVGNPNEFTKNEIALSELGGEDSFDYGLEYYLTNGIEFPDAAVLHYIYKSQDQKCKLFITAPPQGVIAVAVPTKLYVAPDMTAKDMLGTAPEILEAATQITAKEYYSLID